jgi:hypothetical protein
MPLDPAEQHDTALAWDKSRREVWKDEQRIFLYVMIAFRILLRESTPQDNWKDRFDNIADEELRAQLVVIAMALTSQTSDEVVEKQIRMLRKEILRAHVYINTGESREQFERLKELEHQRKYKRDYKIYD